MEDEARIQQILAGLTQPEKKPGLAQSLLTAIPQALAILFSPSPTQDLQKQLEQRQERVDREKERRERVKQLGAQLQIEDILQRGRERRQEEATIRAEGRAETRGIAIEERADIRDIAKFNRESGFQEKMANLTFSQNKELADINFGYNKDLAQINQNYNIDLEKLRSSNNITQQKIGNELSFVLPLMYSGHFNGKDAADIYDKISKGEKLTADESKRISQASKSLRNEKYRQELAVANAQRGGSGGVESMVTKGIQWAQTRAGATDLGMDAQGNVHELRPSPLTGEGTPLDPNVKITRFLSEDEQFKYYYNTLPISKVQPIGGTSTNVPDEKALSAKLDDVIKTAREKDRNSDAEIIQNLNNPEVQKRLGVTPQQVQEAIARNKLNPQSTSSPLPLSEGLTPESLGVSNIKAQPGIKEASAAEIEAKLKEDLKKVGAANIVRGLIEKLQQREKWKTFKQYKTSPKFRQEVEDDIKDIKGRLEYSYSQHPELRPK